MPETQDPEIRFLKDEAAIRNVIHRFARGLDRCDRALISSCFHDDATDDHGMFKGSAAEFCDWVMIELAKFERTQHFITNILVQTDEMLARSESCFLAYRTALTGESPASSVAAGRYLDSFESRNGQWKLSHRKAVYDWSWAGSTTDIWTDPAMAVTLWRGSRTKDDPSYAHLSFG